MADHPIRVEISDEYDPRIPIVLPHEKVFSVQVGYRLFRISGLSLSSDAPSYFTRYFSQPENTEKVLFIDRSPVVFEKIYNHLQGYPINVENDYDFIHLWSDCFYFGFKKMLKFLSEDIFATIGDKSFKISKSLFVVTGNYPNFFTVNFDSMISDDLSVVEEIDVLRPLPQRPATVANRSPALFNDLLELLRGNHLIIKNDEHRQLLIRECKYYRFLELEQRIVKHRIINNPFSPSKQEIILNLVDLNRRGISNISPPDMLREVAIQYVRPFMPKEPSRSLVFQFDCNYEKFNHGFSEVKLILNKKLQMSTIQITNKLCQKIMQVFKEFSDDFMTESSDSDNPSITFIAGFSDCKTLVNGMEMKDTWVQDIIGVVGEEEEEPSASSKKRRLSSKLVVGDIIEFKLTRSLWRMMMRGGRSRLHAVSIEGITDEKTFVRENIDFL